MSLIDVNSALQKKVTDLQTALTRALEAERIAKQRAELLERTTAAAWRLSMMGPRRGDEPKA